MNIRFKEYTFEQFAALHKFNKGKMLDGCMIWEEIVQPNQHWASISIDAYLLIICNTGALQIKQNSCLHIISQDTAFFYLPGNTISCTCERNSSITYLVISQEFMKNHFCLGKMAMIFHKIKSAPQIYLSEIAQAEIRQMTECAKYCINNAYLSVWSKKAAISSVKMILYNYLQQIKFFPDDKGTEKKTSFRNEDIYSRFMQYVFIHCREKRNVEFYASKLFVTSKYLSTVIKNVTGKTASDWIEDVLIEEIQYELKHSNESISEIAFKLNFPNISFFGKFFKRKTGVSPLKYRKDFSQMNSIYETNFR